MSQSVQKLFEAARRLTVEEQAELLDLLLDCGDGAEHDAAWAEEAGQRLAAYERGEATAIDADEVLAEGRRRLAARRDKV